MRCSISKADTGERLRAMLWCLLLGLGLAVALQRVHAASADVLLQRDVDGLYLSATTNWQPAPSVLDAMQRGVPMTFVMQAQVLKPRWYWWDKSVQTTLRIKRLAYQPLTRQWRISSSSETLDGSTGLNALHQNVDDLDTALALITRTKHWRIASNTVIDADDDWLVRFSFRLDLSALPRPFQIGVDGNPDWTLDMEGTYAVPSMSTEAITPEALQ